MILNDLIGEVKDRTVTIIHPEGVTEFGPNGHSYWYTIQRACRQFGERAVLGIYNLDELGTVIEVA